MYKEFKREGPAISSYQAVQLNTINSISSFGAVILLGCRFFVISSVEPLILFSVHLVPFEKYIEQKAYWKSNNNKNFKRKKVFST